MRGPVENFQKRLPLGIPKRDSCGRNLPVFPALKLNVETLISTPDQSPPNDVDVLDDDYWFHEIFRAPKLSGNLRPTHLPSTSGGPMPNRKNGGRNGWNVSGDSGNWCSRRTKPAIPESGKKWMRWCSVRRRREPHQRRYKPPPLPGSASVPCARVLAKSEEPPPRKKRPRAHDQWRGNPTAAPPASTAAFPASLRRRSTPARASLPGRLPRAQAPSALALRLRSVRSRCTRSAKTSRVTPRCAAISAYRQPSTIRCSNSLRSSGARSRRRARNRSTRMARIGEI